MVSQFTVRLFFLHVSNDLLKHYFERRGELLDFPWQGFALDAPDPLYEAWCALPADARAESEGEFRAVAEVATTEGVRQLVTCGAEWGLDLREELARRDGLEHKAFWAFMTHRDVFDAARELCHVEQLTGRYRRVRTGLPRREPDASPGGRRALATALSAYFRPRDGRAEHCDVHWHRLGGLHCFVCLPEDYARSVLTWEGGALRPRTHRPPFEVAYAFDPVQGTLELRARGDKHLHADLQQIFCRVQLGEEVPREVASSKPVFHLNRLKTRHFPFPTDPAHGIRDVRLKKLGLAILGGHGGIDLKAPAPQTGRTLYDLMDNWIRAEHLPLTNVDVDAATIEMQFVRPVERQLTFSMRPTWCNLGDEPDHQIARACLRMWELACA